MKIVAAVFADFVQAPAGGPSQLQTVLGGHTIIERTLRRLMQVDGLAGRCLFVRARDREPAAGVLASAGLEEQIELLPLDIAPRNRRVLLTAARKWNLESWRGSPLGATWFDEFVDPPAAALVLDHYGCDGVFCLDGHQPVFDPAIATAMLASLEEHKHESKICFTQAPPGLAGIILRREALADVLELEIPLGLVLSYRPELAQTDPIIHAACLHVAPQISETAARLTGDTRRSRELLDLALRELGEDASAAALCAWTRAPGHDRAGPLPVEVEFELTTADPLPNTTLRPRGNRVPHRHMDDLGRIAHLAEQLAEYDDRLVFLAGHGDPLQHPQFGKACRILRSAGVYGIGVGTPLLDLSDANFAALFENQVDIVEVRLDAHTAATYQRVHGLDGLARVHANIDRLERTRREHRTPQPIVACSLTRCAATIGDMEAFFDDWIRQLGTAVIHGYNDYCGALPPDTLLPTVAPFREPCRRLATRLMLLADGTVALCGQDVRGEVRLGDWATESLRAIWSGPALGTIRRAHERMGLEPLPLCRRCCEWNRP